MTVWKERERALEPSGRTLELGRTDADSEPAGRGLESARKGLEPARRGLELAARASELVDRASDPSGRVCILSGINSYQLKHLFFRTWKFTLL